MTPQERLRYGKLIAQAGPRDAAVIAALALVAGDRAVDGEMVKLAPLIYSLGLAVGAYEPDYAKALMALTTPPSEDQWVAHHLVTEVAPLAGPHEVREERA